MEVPVLYRVFKEDFPETGRRDHLHGDGYLQQRGAAYGKLYHTVQSGRGRPDILVRYPSVREKAVILEIKVAKTYRDLEKKCNEALRQIEEQKYEEGLRREGYQDIRK